MKDNFNIVEVFKQKENYTWKKKKFACTKYKMNIIYRIPTFQ